MPIDAEIRNIIKNKGNIKIDDMMSCALSTSKNSYYKALTDIGKDGDFITSPEISQLFGEILAIWAIEKWQKMGSPKDFLLMEFGPGQGKLMQDFLRVAKLVPEFYEGAQLYLYEINSHFIKKQKDNLSLYNKGIEWINDIKKIPSMPMIFIANEFFDALAIKQYIKSDNKWFEVVLITDPITANLKFNKIELQKNLQEYFQQSHIEAKDGAIIEESLESLKIIRSLSDHILVYGGSGLIIDYGYNIETKSRSRSQYNPTLQAIKNHQYHSVIDSLGEADLTAHVDFNALLLAAKERGVSKYRYFTQGDFLSNYGIEIRVKKLKESVSIEDKEILDKQLFRLISPKQMGELFKVLEISGSQMRL